MLVLMTATVTVLVVVVVMLVLMTATVTVLVVVVVMLVLMTATVAMLVVVVVMLVLMTATVAMLAVVVMVMLMAFVLKLAKSILKGVLALYSKKYIFAVKVAPRRGYDNRVFVMLTQKSDCCRNLFVLRSIGVRKDYCRCVFNLIVKELAKVLHIHFALVDICNGGKRVKLRILDTGVFHRLYYVGELTYARRLDNHSVGVKFVKHLYKCRRKITYKGAADAAGVHFGYFDSRILKKAAVNTDFTKLIFDKNDFLTRIGFLYQFLNKRSLSGSQKARKNINFSHFCFNVQKNGQFSF